VSTETVRHLFVYGTLRQGSPAPQAAYLAKQAVYQGRAKLAGRLLHLGRYPGLLRPSEASQWVQGDLYELPEGGALWEELDRYEGCHEEDPEPQEYRRVLGVAWSEDGSELECWTYEYQGDAGESPLIASGDWLRA
jgi:gamma-glutamylcyclotransferase (GGCT)/AIG2-like uncharacterized protein YtfP